jgi:hypothetical protein
VTPDRGVAAFWVDEDYDREYASDGVSRYWSSLRRRSGQFRWDGMVTRDPELFALTAFEIGSPPIMSPGYVRHHPRVQHVTRLRDDYGRYALAVDLAAPLPAGAPDYLSGWSWAGWCEDQGWAPPWDNDRPAAYTTLTIRMPVSADWLPKATYDESGNPSWLPVQLAVHTLCARLCDTLAETLISFGS